MVNNEGENGYQQCSVWSLLKAISSFLYSPWIGDMHGMIVHTATVLN